MKVVVYETANNGAVNELVEKILGLLKEVDIYSAKSTCKMIRDALSAAIFTAAKGTSKEVGAEFDCVGNGSTACCYSLNMSSTNSCQYKRPTIIKEFRPLAFVNERTEMRPNGFFWIDEVNGKDRDCLEFLQDFKRYLQQSEIIASIIAKLLGDDAVLNDGVSNFINPELCISSIGLIYKQDKVAGYILENNLANDECENRLDIDVIAEKLKALLEISYSVKDYHEKKIFNGDLKPSNIFVLTERGKRLTVRNIDYDTCLILKEGEFVIADGKFRTTRIFYPLTDLEDILELALSNVDEANKALLNLDVAALGNMLIYTFLNEEQREMAKHRREDDGREMAREDFGFDDNSGSVSHRLFVGLGSANSIVKLEIFKKLQDLIWQSVLVGANKRINIWEFTQRLETIIAYLDCARTPQHISDFLLRKDVPQVDILRFANLHRLDQVIEGRKYCNEFDGTDKLEYKYSCKLNENTPEQYIQQIFYTK